MSKTLIRGEIAQRFLAGKTRSEIFQDLSHTYASKLVAGVLSTIPTKANKAKHQSAIDLVARLLYVEMVISVVTLGIALWSSELVFGPMPELEDPEMMKVAIIFAVVLVAINLAVNVLLIKFVKRFSFTALSITAGLSILAIKTPAKELLLVLAGRTPPAFSHLFDLVGVVMSVVIFTAALKAIKLIFPDRGKWGKARRDDSGNYLFTEEPQPTMPRPF